MLIALIVLGVLIILILAIGGGNKCLPEHLHKNHDDWRWYVAWVPRAWTARCGWAWPQPPKKLLGNSGWTMEDRHMFGHHSDDFYEKNRHILPIVKAGNFMVTAVLFMKFIPLPMMIWAFKKGGYISLGVVRWDDVDSYYDLFRLRASKWRGRVAMVIMVILPVAAVVYFRIWPWLRDLVIGMTFSI